jgi:hypothetical protein
MNDICSVGHSQTYTQFHSHPKRPLIHQLLSADTHTEPFTGNLCLCLVNFKAGILFVCYGLAWWMSCCCLVWLSHVPSRKPPSCSTFSHSLKGIPIYLTKYDRQAAFFKCQNIEKIKGLLYENGRLSV